MKINNSTILIMLIACFVSTAYTMYSVDSEFKKLNTKNKMYYEYDIYYHKNGNNLRIDTIPVDTIYYPLNKN